MSTSLLLAVLIISILMIWVETFELRITPDHIRTSKKSQTISIMCYADAALTGCQFRWWNQHEGRTSLIGPLLDMGLGRYSTADPAHLDRDLLGYSYRGQGLGAGECGLTMRITGFKVQLVSCRVKAGAGGWKYAWMDVLADNRESLPHKMVPPRELVVLPGKTASLLIKTEEPIDQCRMYPPGQAQLVFDEGSASPASKGRHTYHGAGLQQGECGINIANVTETDNRYVSSYMGSNKKEMFDIRLTPVVVAVPPSAPVINVVYNGTEVRAFCEVGESRPVANITWFLADEIIRQDSDDDRRGTAQDEWRWPWTRGSIHQNLTLSLRPEDGGKLLQCVVSHAALSRPLRASEILRFEGISMDNSEKTRAAMVVETESLALEAAKSKARAEEARARAEEARARAEEAKARGEEAWATNLQEELETERVRRNQSLHAMRSNQSDQG